LGKKSLGWPVLNGGGGDEVSGDDTGIEPEKLAKELMEARCLSFMPVILATWEAEIGSIVV
jgi:hypothetical protein